jgi:hypothetical protein
MRGGWFPRCSRGEIETFGWVARLTADSEHSEDEDAVVALLRGEEECC